MEEQSKPSYYAIIPAEVRYHKDLSPNAKLLYGEITALANKHSYCFASNAYFERLFDVKTRSIQNWISLLLENEFIEDLGITDSGFRKLGVQKNASLPHAKKCTHNNTRSSSLKEEERKDKKNLSDSTTKNLLSSGPKKRKRLGKGNTSEKNDNSLQGWSDIILGKEPIIEKELSPCIEIIEHWKSKGFPRPMLKTIRRAKKHIEEKILPKYSIEQVKQSIDNFERETIAKVSIMDFFILSRYQKAVNKAKLSPFEIYLDTELNKLGKKIQENFNHNFLTDDTNNSKKQIQDFNNAAKMLISLMKKKPLEKAGQSGTRIDYIFLLFEALDNQFGEQISSGNLCSEYTFNTAIPKYIRETYGG